MTSSTLSSALSSMEVMLDALMQRGVGKPEEKPKEEEEPPVLPTRPTARGRLRSLQRPGAPAAPWIQPPPPQEEREKCAANLELERRAAAAEEAAKQKDEEIRQKEDEIAALRQQVEHYESRLSECEARMKSVEEELQKQIATLQMAQSGGARTGGSTAQHRRELPAGDGSPARLSGTKAEDASVTRQQPRGCEPATVVVDERQTEAVSRLAAELQRESEAFEHGVVHVAAGEAKPSAKSVDELKRLKRQFGAWKKEYEARLRKTKAELKKLVHSERSHGANRRRCGWWKIKAPKCRVPKCCAIRLPSPSSCCCFRRCC